MTDYGYVFGVFVAMMLVTFAERALPFAASRWLKQQAWVKALGAFLPLAIMVLLTVHSATGAALSHGGLPVAEVASILLTVLLQWFFKSPLVSIFSGTALYVLLRNGFLAGLI